ncbi:MAG: FprA family A-type flavoprotein [Lachnospiraceae bacterium]|nr:FprA family A-type flavoprotein [Lachnospiraceae bacterium]
MNYTEISDAIRYIGVDDDNIDLFESQYVVPEGMAYNSYIILDEKIVVLDTCDKRGSEEWLANLAAALGDRKPDYLVIHHMEPDHAGTLAQFMQKYPDAVLVGNAKTFNMLPNYYDAGNMEKLTVKEGDTLSLGAHTLQFFMAPMVHWPEVMVSFEQTEGVLFAADGFGKFGAIKNETDDWACEARRYYFNICGKYGMQVQALLKKAAKLDIKVICPLHGPVLKENLGYYIGLYDTWSKYEPENKGVLIAVASIHGNTLQAAEYMKEQLEALGEERVSLMEVPRSDVAEIIEDAFRYDRMILMASSYDAGVFLPMEDLLVHLRAKGYQNRKVALVENGSWGPTAAKTMKGYLEGMKNITILDPVVTIKSAVKEADKEALAALAKVVKDA